MISVFASEDDLTYAVEVNTFEEFQDAADVNFNGNLLSFFVSGKNDHQMMSLVQPDKTLFWDSLNERQRDTVMNRLLHRLLRSYASCLPPPFVTTVSVNLIQAYIRRRNFQEALDVAIIRTEPSRGTVHDSD